MKNIKGLFRLPVIKWGFVIFMLILSINASIFAVSTVYDFYKVEIGADQSQRVEGLTANDANGNQRDSQDCYTITNNHDSGSAIFIPTRTAGEWQAFRDNVEANTGGRVFVDSCDPTPVDGACGPAHNGSFTVAEFASASSNYCNTTGGHYVEDSSASDGTFNWECYGWDDGSDASCSASKRVAVVNSCSATTISDGIGSCRVGGSGSSEGSTATCRYDYGLSAPIQAGLIENDSPRGCDNFYTDSQYQDYQKTSSKPVGTACFDGDDIYEDHLFHTKLVANGGGGSGTDTDSGWCEIITYEQRCVSQGAIAVTCTNGN